MVIVAVGQLSSTSDMAANALRAGGLVRQAAARGARLLVLPEASDYIAKNAQHSKELAKSVEESPFVTGLLAAVREVGCVDVAVGVHEPSGETAPPGGLPRTKNTLLYFNAQGALVSRYQKVHLFDVDVPGGAIMRESDSVQPGRDLVDPVATPAGRLGLAVCYDLRFPKLALKQRALGAELIAYPSAWTVKTGPHFQPLGIATAIFSQSYVLLPAQTGVHGDTQRESFGHSCIVDPNGVVVAQVAQGEGICTAEIDLGLVRDLREKMPLLQQSVDL